MGGVRRRLGWHPLRLVAVVVASLGIVVLTAAASPARAAGSNQAEQPIRLDGDYTGTYTVRTIITPPDIADAGMVLTPGDVLAFALHLVTDGSGGGEAQITFYYEGAPLMTQPASLTWNGSHLEIDLHSEGAFEEDWHFDGDAARGDGVVILSGDWTACCYAYPAGVWEATRPLSEQDETTSTTSTIPSDNSLGGASTSTFSPATMPAGSEAGGSEASEGGGQSALALFESGGRGVFPEGRTSAAGVAMLVLVLIFVLVAGGMAVKAAIAEALGGTVWVVRRRPPTVEQMAPWLRAMGQELTGTRGIPTTVSGPVEPWSRPDAGAPRAGFMLQPGERCTVMASTGPGPDHWVLLRSDSSGVEGWVHRSALTEWQREVPSHWVPAPTAAWEWVHFSERLETRLPNGVVNLYQPGWYRLGPPDASGYRQVVDSRGHPLVGTIHANRVPPPPGRPTSA